MGGRTPVDFSGGGVYGGGGGKCGGGGFVFEGGSGGLWAGRGLPPEKSGDVGR